jgi:hypothetical protein
MFIGGIPDLAAEDALILTEPMQGGKYEPRRRVA